MCVVSCHVYVFMGEGAVSAAQQPGGEAQTAQRPQR